MDEEERIPQIKLKSILDPRREKIFKESKKEVKHRFKDTFASFKKPSKILLLVLFIIFIFLVVFVVWPGLSLYKKGKLLYADIYSIKASFDSQDINKVENELLKLEKDVDSFSKSYKRFSWLKAVPFVSGYWKDGNYALEGGRYGIEAGKILVETVKPYADIIGFAGDDSKSAKSGEESANDRIEFIFETIDEVLPKMDSITSQAIRAKENLDKIEVNRYPEKFRGKEVRPRLEKVIELANEVADFLSKSKPLMREAPYLLGIDGERKYLIIFQNDKELRPTGGFITAYSVMGVKNGKLEPTSSNDIYNLDNKYKPTIEAPEVLRKYIKGPYQISKGLRLRDMNWSPDFKLSMEMFMAEVEKAGLEKVDGIIAVDTYVLTYLLDVLGEIEVPGYGNYSTQIEPRCDCPQVIYELESFADVEGPIVWSENDPTKIVYAPPNYDNRKKIVGPLMNSIVRNALGQEKGRLPDLFMAAWRSFTEKHILFYLFDKDAQEGAEAFNIAGRIRDYDGDYLHINDANLGGRKSNLYVTQEVNQEIEIAKDRSIQKTVTITYKNPKEQDEWLNSILPNWIRVYVPKGSRLIESEGFDDRGETYNELDKTVFSGGFQLRPQGVKKVVLKYKLPFKVDKYYRILIQKQAGTDAPLYSIKLGKSEEEFFLRSDKELKFKI